MRMNKQITEDYVSFEIAKLLKEKGFDIPCRQAYFNGSLVDYTLYGFCDGELLNCPSQSLAIKWLREVHNIYIDILTYTTGKNIQFRWVGYDNGRLFSQEKGKTIYFESYEKAVEAAILYVLKNLI